MGLGKIITSIAQRGLKTGRQIKNFKMFPMDKVSAECLLWMSIFTGVPLASAMFSTCTSGSHNYSKPPVNPRQNEDDVNQKTDSISKLNVKS